MKVTILGCGSSGGVPLVGCDCPVCKSGNLKNKRSRVSIIIETKNTNILVDTSPDLREQALKNNIRKIDAVLYTHAHADHTMGIDELRSFNYLGNKIINVYGNRQTLAEIKTRFDYAFKLPIAEYGWFRPALNAVEIISKEHFVVEDIKIQAIPQIHGRLESLGFRINNFAYSTDVNNFSDEAMQLLTGLDLWVVDCLKYAPAPTHAHLKMTLKWIQKLKPKRAILTHMSHDFEYEKLKSELPENVEPAYDGMVLGI